MISSTDDISDIWAADCKIDESNLGGESKRIPELHNKYYSLYYKEALKVKKLKYDLGWKPNPRKIIRNDLDKHIQADKEVIRLSLRIDYHSARANFLEDIIKTIHSRNFIIKSMIDILKFQHGEY